MNWRILKNRESENMSVIERERGLEPNKKTYIRDDSAHKPTLPLGEIINMLRQKCKSAASISCGISQI